MQRIELVKVAMIERDKEQPRKAFDEAELIALGENMKVHGQQVPVIVYPCEGKLMLLDGERRWRASKVAGITDLLAVILPAKPSATQLHLLQMSLEAHKVGLTPMERSNLLAKIKQENNWNVTELAANLQMKQPTVTKLLSFQRLEQGIQNLLHTGGLEMEKAFIISQEPDHNRQMSLVQQHAHASREQLRARVGGSDDVQRPKAKRAVFALGGSVSVAIQGAEMTLEDAIEKLTELVKELKRGLSQSLTIASAQRVLADKARSK